MANKYSTIVHSPAALPAISRNEFDSKSNVQIKTYNKLNKAGTFRKLTITVLNFFFDAFLCWASKSGIISLVANGFCLDSFGFVWIGPD